MGPPCRWKHRIRLRGPAAAKDSDKPNDFQELLKQRSRYHHSGKAYVKRKTANAHLGWRAAEKAENTE